jgi:hypothetical protein
VRAPGPGRSGAHGDRTGATRPAPALTATVLALAAAAAAAALSGCASSGAAAEEQGAAPSGPARAVEEAADMLVRAGSSRVTTSMRMASGGTWLTITGTGGFDYARRRGELRLELPKDAAGAEEHKPITELLTPGALYMKDRGAGVPAGKWVRVDTTRLADGNLVTGGATEPLAAADLLRGARQVTLVGDETRGGVRVRHYRGTADIARAARAAPAVARGPLEAAAKGFPVTRVPFDAWLDSAGRLRELSQRFTFTTEGSDAGGATAGDTADADTTAGDTATGDTTADGASTGTDSPRTNGAKGTKGATGIKQGSGQDVTVVSTTRFDHFGAEVSVIMPRPADIWTGKIVSAQPR